MSLASLEGVQISVMSNQVTDLILHIDETVRADRLRAIESAIEAMDGVVSARNRQDKPHLITVMYHPENVSSHDILDQVIKEGYHAELVGCA